MIRFENASKSYGGGSIKALDGLSMDIAGGKVFGFIGPNGAGKTTTIKLMTGILQPDEGCVWLDGISMADKPLEAKRTFGYVPDNFSLFERMTGNEYLRFLADLYHVQQREKQERLEKYLALFDFETIVYRQIRGYSHGMKQKLSVIGSLLHQPRVWILDEPMTGLDPKSMHVLKEEMKQHSRRGGTVFFSTHVLDVAERLCDEIGIINQGRLIAKGTLDELRGDDRVTTLEELFLDLTSEEEE